LKTSPEDAMGKSKLESELACLALVASYNLMEVASTTDTV